jgi:hypothetical protein
LAAVALGVYAPRRHLDECHRGIPGTAAVVACGVAAFAPALIIKTAP